MRYSVAIVAIARNEGQYINEWIEYHHALGFEHFYIYDNSFGKEERLSQSISAENKKIASIIPAYNKRAFQKQAYGHAYNKFGQKHDYLLFIDIDEFFTLVQHKDISEYILFLNARCPGFQNARIHWEIYDDNNAIERDMSVPVHEFFTQLGTTKDSVEHNNSTKSLVKTGMSGVYFPNVHFPGTRTHGQMVVCDSTGREIHPTDQFIYPRDVSIAKIRHYITKTISEYMWQKMGKWDGDGYVIKNIWNRFFNYSKQTQEKIDYYVSHKDEIYSSCYVQLNDGGFPSGKKHEKIVVTMTSWIKRIENCVTVVESILNQTMKPNVVFLNLSLEEFPGREIDLPRNLVNLSRTHPEFKINWLEGNDKQFKKLFPILEYLDDDDIIMTTDDDVILNNRTIEKRYSDFIGGRKKFAIKSELPGNGVTMMTQKKMFSGYQMFLTDAIKNSGNDDEVYYNLLYLNGYTAKVCSDCFLMEMNHIKDSYGLTDNNAYITWDVVDRMMADMVEKKYHRKWNEMFGAFRQSPAQNVGETHDLPSGGEFNEYQLERTFNEKMERFFYGDSLSSIDSDNTILFVGSDIPNQMGKNVLCCGLGWKYLPGQKHKAFRQLVPPSNFCYLRGDISRRQLMMEGVNIKKSIPNGDTRLFSAKVFGEQVLNPTMDIGIVVGQNQQHSRAWYLNMAREKFPDKEIGFIETTGIGFDELAEFVSQCRVVLTSSLWGVSVAHSFGVPAFCFLESHGYEFMDYYSVFKRIRYIQLAKKISFQEGLENVVRPGFAEKVNPTKDEIKLVQRNILSALPYGDRVAKGIIEQ